MQPKPSEYRRLCMNALAIISNFIANRRPKIHELAPVRIFKLSR